MSCQVYLTWKPLFHTLTWRTRRTSSSSPLKTLGFKKEEIDISICGNSVEISGCKEMSTDEKNKDYVRKERMSESFYRTMTMPEENKVRRSKRQPQGRRARDSFTEEEPKKAEISPNKVTSSAKEHYSLFRFVECTLTF